jgi:hypothetical protein
VFVVFLYILNSFSTFTSLGPHANCSSRGGFYCTNASMNTKGKISLIIAQDTGIVLHNVALSCVVNEPPLSSCITNGFCEYNSSFYPKNYTFNSSSFGIADLLRNSNDTLSSVSIKNLSCYTFDGKLLGIQNQGTNFSNIYVWLRYTSSNTSKSFSYLPGAFALYIDVT